jgi:hypothetical protein
MSLWHIATSRLAWTSALELGSHVTTAVDRWPTYNSKIPGPTVSIPLLNKNTKVAVPLASYQTPPPANCTFMTRLSAVKATGLSRSWGAADRAT